MLQTCLQYHHSSQCSLCDAGWGHPNSARVTISSPAHIAARWPRSGVSVRFYQEWVESRFCSVRWTKKNILRASYTKTGLAQSNSWLVLVPERARGEVRALTTAPVTLELKKHFLCTPQKYSRVSAPAHAVPGPVNACTGLCLNHSLPLTSPSEPDLNSSVWLLVITLVSFTM